MSSYKSFTSRLKVGKAGVAIPAYRVLAWGVDGKVYPASYNSGNVFGVSTKECAGANSGVEFVTVADGYAVLMASSAVTRGQKVMIENTGQGMVRPWTPTGSVSTGQVGHSGIGVDGLVNYVGIALEAAASSGTSFLAWFGARGW